MPKFIRFKAPGEILQIFLVYLLVVGVPVTTTTGSIVYAQGHNEERGDSLQNTVSLAAEVKAFGRSLGILPTEALTRSSKDRTPRSMLWLWLQRSGTLALRAPIDLRMFLSFAADSKTVALDHVYRVQGYSVYYRQGDEFADSGSVVTESFAREDLLRRVQVILHEDLHGDENFSLPWELEESLVTPLGALATVEFFRRKGDGVNMTRALRAFARERTMSQELTEFSERALKLFGAQAIDAARASILQLMESYPSYLRVFRSQTKDQDAESALEAKISHDLVYYRYFDRIAVLAEVAPDLRSLILALKDIPSNATVETLDLFLYDLTVRYRAVNE